MTVFPDIIVHHRGGDNLMVIEAKKSTSGVPKGLDYRKLEAFKAQLRYPFAVFVLFVTAEDEPEVHLEFR